MPNSAPAAMPLAGRVAVVTGASRGIGAAVAIKLGALGAHVLCLARTVGGLEETDDAIRAAGGSATLVPIDFREPERLDALAAPMLERFGRCDILVAAAAVAGPAMPLAHVKPKDWAEAFAVNVHAPFRLIRALDPLLRTAPAGHVVLPTCALAKAGKPYLGIYAATKAALEAMATAYAEEVSMTPLRVHVIDPGITATRLRAKLFPGDDPLALASPTQAADSLVDCCLI
jgi:NAD(P)-dependent dehydrogenase (short-subunit alcohol dehydrogenase family)